MAFILVPGIRYLTFAGAPSLIELADGQPAVRHRATLSTCATACSREVDGCDAFQLLLEDLTDAADAADKAGDCYFYSDVSGPDQAYPDPRAIVGQRRTGKCAC